MSGESTSGQARKAAEEAISRIFTDFCRHAGRPGVFGRPVEATQPLLDCLVKHVAQATGSPAVAGHLLDEVGSLQTVSNFGFNGLGQLSEEFDHAEPGGCACPRVLAGCAASTRPIGKGAVLITGLLKPSTNEAEADRCLVLKECRRLGLDNLFLAVMRDGQGKPVCNLFIAASQTNSPVVEFLVLFERESLTLAGLFRRAQHEEIQENLLRLLSESVALIDRSGNMLYINETGAQRLGHPRHEVIGRSLGDLIAPELFRRRLGVLAERESQGGDFVYEDTRDGRTFRHQVYPEFDSRGRLARFAVVSTDVTVLRRVEDALKVRTRADRFLALISARFSRLSARTFEAGLYGALLEIGRLLGVDAAFLMTFNPRSKRLEAIHEWCARGIPSVRDRLKTYRRCPNWILRTSVSQGFFEYEEKEGRADEIPLDAHRFFSLTKTRALLVFPIFQGGEPAGLLGVLNIRNKRAWSSSDMMILRLGSRLISNVSDRVKMERKLRENQALLEAVIAAIPLELVMIDTEGRYFMANELASRRFGDVVGKKQEDLSAPEALVSLWQENNRRVLQGEEIREENIVDIGGESRHVFNLLSPVRVDDRIIGAVILNLDLTEFRKVEGEFHAIRKDYQAFLKVVRSAARRLREDVLGHLEQGIGLLGGDGGKPAVARAVPTEPLVNCLEKAHHVLREIPAALLNHLGADRPELRVGKARLLPFPPFHPGRKRK